MLLKKCTYTGVNSPLNWYGGKYYLRKQLIPLFPPHHLYAEGCGGAAHVLAGKSPSPIEVYNDIHSGLYNFFKILRDPVLCDTLIYNLQNTPYSREEFNKAENWISEKSLIEKIRKFYIRTMQSVNTNGGWSASLPGDTAKGMAGRASRWISNIDINIKSMAKRLRQVQLENLDIIDFIKKYDAPETFFYLDVTYPDETRTTPHNKYDHEMSLSKHKEIISTVKNIKGKVMISGYDSDLYSELENYGFQKKSLGIQKKRASDVRDEDEEFVWINYSLDFLENQQLSIYDL